MEAAAATAIDVDVQPAAAAAVVARFFAVAGRVFEAARAIHYHHDYQHRTAAAAATARHSAGGGDGDGDGDGSGSVGDDAPQLPPVGFDRDQAEQFTASLRALVQQIDTAPTSIAVASGEQDNRNNSDSDSDSDSDAVLAACRKVTRDLLVHLARFHGSQQHQKEGVSDADGEDVAELARRLWPALDVHALGCVLRDLARRWEEDGRRSGSGLGLDDALVESFSRLRVDGGLASGVAAGGEDGLSVPEEVPGTGSAEPVAGVDAVGRGVSKRSRVPLSILEDFILDGLAYKSMRDREEEVTEAHNKTFEWIFGADGDSTDTGKQHSGGHTFRTWLEADGLGPLFWISGKPGSGKSTLTRFLFEHGATTQCLAAWAKGRPVAKAGFFFWTSGSREQRSQTGLLRYLLHQLLSADRALIPTAFPGLWQRISSMTTKERIQVSLEWTAPDLMAAFGALLDAMLPRANVCLFVDGLDEFDGDHGAMIDFFKDLGAGRHGRRVKICLSSRPWDVFEKAFKHHAIPSLKLQDLTFVDMRTYADDSLRQNVHVRRLAKKSPPQYDRLVDETVQRADGVFLWVRLAVSRLIQNFEPGQGMASLEAALDSLPRELDELFEKLLFQDQTAAELADTAALFQLVRAREAVADFIRDESANSLTVWELAFALAGSDDDDTALLGPAVEQIGAAECRDRYRRTTAYIRARSAGLLDMYASHAHGGSARRGGQPARFAALDVGAEHPEARLLDAKVTYIHRTVRDWLVGHSGAVQARLQAGTADSFDPHVRLLRSYVLRLKQPLAEPERHRRLDEWWPDIALAMTHAAFSSSTARGSPGRAQLRALVNALDATISWLWLSSDADDHWARRAFGSYEVRMKAPPIRAPFLCLTVRFGLRAYVEDELEARREEEILRGSNAVVVAGAGAGAGAGASAGSDANTDDYDDNNGTPLLAYATEFLCSRQKTLYPLSSRPLVAYLLSHPSPSRSNLNPGPNHRYTDFHTHKPTTAWLAVARHLRDARRRGWLAHYDTAESGARRWAGVVRDFVELGGADVHAVVLADHWDPEVTVRGVLDLLCETYGDADVAEVRDVVVRRAGGC